MSSNFKGNTQAKKEYKYFLETYLLPMLGVTDNKNKNLEDVLAGEEPLQENAGSYVRQESDRIYFSFFDEDVFSLYWKPRLDDDSVKLAREVIRSFFQVSKYQVGNHRKGIKLNYQTDVIREENYRLAVQKGVCDWCAGGSNDAFYRLIQILETWSVQTYEGNKVTFGFIYDPQAESTFGSDYGSWLDFLEDDYAATLTDCIHSVILLDKNCNFVSHLSITEGNKVSDFQLSSLLPYRFAPILERHVFGSRVGVFLLNNGDILISKNRALQLIKRNLKWLNLSYDTFLNMIDSKLPKNTIPEALIEQIYASVLDVSLAHSGGIIAVVPNISNLLNPSNPVLSPCDYLLDKRSLSEIEKEMRDSETNKNLSYKEIKKRILKRKVLSLLVDERSFTDLDRKLRTEIISMDGACILNAVGKVCAVGAIIRNDSGSSGGGRSAAAKKLSVYDGFAVKISTDGYIELFVNYEPVLSIK